MLTLIINLIKYVFVESNDLAKIHGFSEQHNDDNRTVCSLATLLAMYRPKANSHSTSSPSRMAVHVMVSFKLGEMILKLRNDKLYISKYKTNVCFYIYEMLSGSAIHWA